MTKADVVRRLKERTHAAGSQAALARELRITPAYLSQVLRGTREPGPKLLQALGLERVIRRVVEFKLRRRTRR